jgi:hypothetical protein
MREIPPAILEHRCSCGAQCNESSKRCRKCSARARWYRHKAWRSRKALVRYRTGKK